MTKLITLRDEPVPEVLVVLRMGSTTLSDRALGQSCERAHANMGIHAFSVLELRDDDYSALARLAPILLSRPRVLRALGADLLAAGFTLLPTGAVPHWSVVLSEPTLAQFARVRACFRGPIDNPAWAGRNR